MIRPGFLDIELRQNLIELARDGLAAHRLARRANALVLLDDGMSCEAIAKVLLLDDDTIRTWYRLYEGDGIEGLTNFSYEGSACQLSGEQQEKLKAWVATALPRTTRQVGAWIENEFGVVYEGRSGLIALLHRLGLEYHKPNVIPRKLDEEKQRAFIEGYEKLLNSLGDDEAVLFADAVHPTHAARPVGCWAPSQEKLAIEQTSGRQRINIHGAIDLETGQTRMIEALTIDAASTIRLLQSIEALYPMLALIHVFLDNARYHHAKLVQEWLALPGRRIKLHFIPTYCPHLNPIERLWGLMHRNVTHNKCYATCAQFADATLSFLREKVPGNWADLCDSVTDNFRVINPKDFRVMTERGISRRQLTRSNRAGETRRTDAGAVHGVGSSLCTRTARKQHHKLIEVPWRACKRRDRCTSFFRTQHQSRRIHRHGARHDGSPQGDHARENHSESGPLWPPPSRPFDIQSRRSDNDSTHRYLLAQCLPRSLRSCSARRLLAVASFASRRFCAVDRSVLELCFFGPRIAIEP